MPSIPRLYVGCMNDAAFVIDQKPRPAPVDRVNPDALPRVNVIAACGTKFALAQQLVDAWNAVLDREGVEVKGQRIKDSVDAMLMASAGASALNMVSQAVSESSSNYPQMSDQQAGDLVRSALSFIGVVAAVQPGAIDCAILNSHGSALDVLEATAKWGERMRREQGIAS